jgi:hypothetical protein
MNHLKIEVNGVCYICKSDGSAVMIGYGKTDTNLVLVSFFFNIVELHQFATKSQMEGGG